MRRGGAKSGRIGKCFPSHQQLSQVPITECVRERGRETEDISNHSPEGMHFILYSYQGPATHFSSFHSQGDQDGYFQPRVSDGPEGRMACPRSWLVAKLDL